ncbi:hypothetical protein JOQ06_020874, partial [Pogonophryne albipinna]
SPSPPLSQTETAPFSRYRREGMGGGLCSQIDLCLVHQTNEPGRSLPGSTHLGLVGKQSHKMAAAVTALFS